MKTAEDTLIRRAAGAIVIISSLIIISLMITGGCSSSDGNPTPTNAPTTGFPPECNGTFDVSLSCPATSLAGSFCQTYVCDIIDDGTEPVVITESLFVRFGEKCTDIDCFTLECQDLRTDSDSTIGEAIILVETVSGTPVGEGVEGEVFSGLPDGRIIIGDEDFQLDCNGLIVP